FSEDPEDPGRIIVPSGRLDEIGTAERELGEMQRQLSGALLQKTRLAQLGLAVSKINHDLRGMLANAQLLSDRLTAIPDPTVQRFAPKLIASLDRAINFSNDTLRFGRPEEGAPRRGEPATGYWTSTIRCALTPTGIICSAFSPISCAMRSKPSKARPVRC